MSAFHTRPAAGDVTLTTIDDFLFEVGHDHAERFHAWFRSQDNECYLRYRALAIAQGQQKEFEVNPLAVILMNKPACCLKYAEEYCRAAMNEPFKVGDIYWHRCKSTGKYLFHWVVKKICKKTVKVHSIVKIRASGLWQEMEYEGDKSCRKVEHELHNTSRRIYLCNWRKVAQ